MKNVGAGAGPTFFNIFRHCSTLFDIFRHCSTFFDNVRHFSTLFDFAISFESFLYIVITDDNFSILGHCPLIGEGFIFLREAYGFMGGTTIPFTYLKKLYLYMS